jgi:diketogulonate reductase-like aldo/keto reductase
MTTATISLNNGVEMPAIGLGVFQTPPDVTTDAVAEALRVRHRLVDTAAAYMNEREVGEGIRRSGVDRDEVFIETKLWISDYGYEAGLHAFEKSAKKLGVDGIDLLLLHQPLDSRFDLTLDAYWDRYVWDRAVEDVGWPRSEDGTWRWTFQRPPPCLRLPGRSTRRGSRSRMCPGSWATPRPG